MPSDATFRLVNGFQRAVQKLTFGKLGWKGYGMPVVELTTTGAKSGQPRTVLLTSPVREGRTIVVVASRFGDDRNPAWLHNVRANPEVQVKLQGQPARTMVAHEADADERARLWPRVVADHSNYADYQRKTDREIPLVLLEPAT